jgi:hypothetical protein
MLRPLRLASLRLRPVHRCTWQRELLIRIVRIRQEEIESKHPRFAIAKGVVVWVTELGGDHMISPFYELRITLKNVQERSCEACSPQWLNS